MVDRPSRWLTAAGGAPRTHALAAAVTRQGPTVPHSDAARRVQDARAPNPTAALLPDAVRACGERALMHDCNAR